MQQLFYFTWGAVRTLPDKWKGDTRCGRERRGLPRVQEENLLTRVRIAGAASTTLPVCTTRTCAVYLYFLCTHILLEAGVSHFPPRICLLEYLRRCLLKKKAHHTGPTYVTSHTRRDIPLCSTTYTFLPTHIRAYIRRQRRQQRQATISTRETPRLSTKARRLPKEKLYVRTQVYLCGQVGK